ncbi:hypothetical protein D3C86_1270220 [compost metagenome]
MLEHLAGRLDLRVVANVGQHHRVRLRDQLPVTLDHVHAGDRIDPAIDHSQRHFTALHRAHPAVAPDASLRDVGDQFVHDPWPAMAFDQAPEIIHLAFTGTGLRTENLPKASHQAITAEGAANHPAQRAEQEFLHQ